MEEQFRIWITFENGDQHLDTDWCGVETLSSSLIRLVQGPARNLIAEIKVIDMTDSIIFLHQDGKQIFPEVDE